MDGDGRTRVTPHFGAVCKALKIPEPVAEHRFHPSRKWRFDYAWPDAKVALEVEGGAWTRGRHTRGAGFVKDLEKYSEATASGWRVLRVTPDQLLTPDTFDLIRRTLALDTL